MGKNMNGVSPIFLYDLGVSREQMSWEPLHYGVATHPLGTTAIEKITIYLLYGRL